MTGKEGTDVKRPMRIPWQVNVTVKLADVLDLTLRQIQDQCDERARVQACEDAAAAGGVATSGVFLHRVHHHLLGMPGQVVLTYACQVEIP